MAIELLQVSKCFTFGAGFSCPEVSWNLRCRGVSALTAQSSSTAVCLWRQALGTEPTDLLCSVQEMYLCTVCQVGTSIRAPRDVACVSYMMALPRLCMVSTVLRNEGDLVGHTVLGSQR